jgi:hypothetical protein
MMAEEEDIPDLEEDVVLCPQFLIERGFSILELKKRLIFGNIYRVLWNRLPDKGRKSSHKYLGIIINDKLSFSEQSNNIVKTCLKNGDILKNYAVMQMQMFFLNYINLICYLY